MPAGKRPLAVDKVMLVLLPVHLFVDGDRFATKGHDKTAEGKDKH